MIVESKYSIRRLKDKGNTPESTEKKTEKWKNAR